MTQGPTSFDDFRKEEPYGEKARRARLERLTRPLVPQEVRQDVGARPALGATPPPPPPAVAQQPPPMVFPEPAQPPPPTPAELVVAAWRDIASEPGASELVKEYARRAGA